MNNYFNKYQFDFLRVSWAHAVNSKHSLHASLIENVDCIESDLSYCNEDKVVYMSHPPLLRSDLTFKEYWNICKFANKVIKLDFKMIEAVEPCFKEINQKDISSIIVNADILKSSLSIQHPVDKEKFLELCFKYVPCAMISIGWTTSKNSVVGYTWSDVYEMNVILNQFRDSEKMITIPVNENMASKNSMPKLIFLLDQFKNRNLSLTIWSRQNEKIDILSLKTFRQLLSKSSIFIDIPQLLDSEREEILFVMPNPEFPNIILCSNVIGLNYWSSRRSIMIGENTKISFEQSLLSKIEFFVVFDNFKEICGKEISSCSIQLNSKKENKGLIVLTKKGISSQETLITSDMKFEIVFLVSIHFDKSILECTVSIVYNYNTQSMKIVPIYTNNEIIINREDCNLIVNAHSCYPECRFIVLDFLNKDE